MTNGSLRNSICWHASRCSLSTASESEGASTRSDIIDVTVDTPTGILRSGAAISLKCEESCGGIASLDWLYAGCKISASPGYVTGRGEGSMDRARGKQDVLCAIASPPTPYIGWLTTRITVNEARRYLATSINESLTPICRPSYMPALLTKYRPVKYQADFQRIMRKCTSISAVGTTVLSDRWPCERPLGRKLIKGILYTLENCPSRMTRKSKLLLKRHIFIEK
jgi:hypothetical protein